MWGAGNVQPKKFEYDAAATMRLLDRLIYSVRTLLAPRCTLAAPDAR